MTRNRFRSTAALAVTGLLLSTACVDATSRVEAADPPVRPATADRGDDPLRVGEAVTTSRGNTVGVLDVVIDRGSEASTVSTLLEVCAGTASDATTVDLRFFTVVAHDRSVLVPMAPGDARSPALRGLSVGERECHVGWLTFEMEDEQEPVFFVLRSRSSVAHWWLGRGTKTDPR